MGVSSIRNLITASIIAKMECDEALTNKQDKESMDDNNESNICELTGSVENSLEKEKLIWKSRELLLRNRVLTLQLNAAKQAKEATTNVSRTTSKLILSTQNDYHSKLKLKLEELLEEKQMKLEQLYLELRIKKLVIFKRTRQMLKELWLIYPIVEFPDRKGYSICDIHLPSSEHFDGHDEIMVSVAIGYVGHLLILLSEILDISLRFPLRYYGSKSLIYCNRKNQLFPLYVDSFKSRDFINFSYGVSLLDLNIKQIRTLHGLPTTEPEDTLANLHGLRLILDTDDDC